MSKQAIKDIQHALNVIRADLDEANWQMRLEVLQLMLSTSESVVARARQLAEPKPQASPRPKPLPLQKRPAPSSQKISQAPSAPAQQPAVGPQKPIPPLGNKPDA